MVPILELGRSLLVPLMSDLTDSQWEDLRADLLEKAERSRSQGVLLDVSAVDLMDSFAGHSITSIAGTLRLRGVETVVVGIQPEVAWSMVQLGLHLEGIVTALDLDEGLRVLRRRLDGDPTHAR